MLVNELMSHIGDDGGNTYVVTYYNDAGVEIDSTSDFVEFVMEMYGDWRLLEEDAIWIGVDGAGRHKLHLYVEKPA